MRVSIRVALIAALSCAAASGTVHAQDPTTKQLGVLSGVLRYRLYWLGDSTTVNLCLAGGMALADAARNLEPRYRRLVVARSQCDRVAVARQGNSAAYVREVVLVDTTATVALQASRGEYTHTERFELVARDNLWIVLRVILSGGWQSRNTGER